jgi:hypothetical protein
MSRSGSVVTLAGHGVRAANIIGGEDDDFGGRIRVASFVVLIKWTKGQRKLVSRMSWEATYNPDHVFTCRFRLHELGSLQPAPGQPLVALLVRGVHRDDSSDLFPVQKIGRLV